MIRDKISEIGFLLLIFAVGLAFGGVVGSICVILF
jgi:hypothetical protein